MANYIAPSVAGLLGLTGFLTGSMSFRSPYDTIKAFGLVAPSAPSSNHAEAFQTSLIQAYGIRNVGSGLATMGMLVYWFREENLVRKETIKKCLGLTMMLGTAVGMGDAWLVNNFANSKGVIMNADDGEKNAAPGHAVAAVIIAAVGGTLFFY